MRYLLAIFIILFGLKESSAQKLEIGPYIGGSNFIGDVGATNYINPNSLAYGGVFKWNQSPRYSWRASMIFTGLKADDADSNQGRRVSRDYSFSNNLTELMLGMEFNFWDWDIYASHRPITPYLSTGIVGFSTHHLYFKEEMTTAEQYKKKNTGLAIPMIIGAKGRLSEHVSVAFEIGARMTFSNNIDGSAPYEFDKSSSEDKKKVFGNTNQYDWYMFTGLIFTFSFGQNLCFDIY